MEAALLFRMLLQQLLLLLLHLQIDVLIFAARLCLLVRVVERSHHVIAGTGLAHFGSRRLRNIRPRGCDEVPVLWRWRLRHRAFARAADTAAATATRNTRSRGTARFSGNDRRSGESARRGRTRTWRCGGRWRASRRRVPLAVQLTGVSGRERPVFSAVRFPVGHLPGRERRRPVFVESRLCQAPRSACFVQR